MILFFRILVYFSFLIVPLFLFFLGYQQSYRALVVTNNWFQNFNENIVLKRDEKFIERVDEVVFQKKNYHYQDKLAYYNKAGEISYQLNLDNNNFFSASDEYYVLYQKVGDKIEFYDKLGDKKWSLNTFSYPYLSPLNNLILLMSTDNSTISFYDINKNLLLDKSYLGSLITDFQFSHFDGSLFLGTIEGRLYYYNYLGELKFFEKLENSRFNYIKTVAASKNGNYLLSISGLQPEYLTLFNKNGIVVWQKKTLVERRKKSFPYIDESNSKLYDIRNNHIHILNLENGEPQNIIYLPYFDEEIRYSLMDSNQDYFGVVLVGLTKRIFLLYNQQLEVVWKKEFTDDFLTYVEVTPLLLKEDSQTFDILLHSNEGIYFYNARVD